MLRELATKPRWEPSETITRRVRLLIQAVRRLEGNKPERPSLFGGDVLLDVTVDGVRCILLAPRRPLPNLSPREEQIARMVALGYPNKTIAATLNISSWTVSTYLRRIFVKLGVHSRTAMVARLFEESVLGGDGRAATRGGLDADGSRRGAVPVTRAHPDATGRRRRAEDRGDEPAPEHHPRPRRDDW